MNKRSNNILINNGFVFLQSILISTLWLYSQINKWNLRERFTIFFAPIYRFFLVVAIIVSLLISLIYFAKRYIEIHKIYTCFPILINMIIIVIGICFFNEEKLREYNFKKFQVERNEIVVLIKEGVLQPDESGNVIIPDKMSNKEMERNGFVRLINYGEQVGVYFCTFTGLLEISSGYVCFIDKFSDFDFSDENIVLFQSYDDGWHYCSTN